MFFFLFLGYKLEFSKGKPISNLLWTHSVILTSIRKQTKGLLMMVHDDQTVAPVETIMAAQQADPGRQLAKYLIN